MWFVRGQTEELLSPKDSLEGTQGTHVLSRDLNITSEWENCEQAAQESLLCVSESPMSLSMC